MINIIDHVEIPDEDAIRVMMAVSAGCDDFTS